MKTTKPIYLQESVRVRDVRSGVSERGMVVGRTFGGTSGERYDIATKSELLVDVRREMIDVERS